MKITRSQLKQIIKEEMEDMSWSDIAIDKAVSALVESTYDYDPPQELLDGLENAVRATLNAPEIKSIFDAIVVNKG